jgi:hypothetical protein
MLPEKRQMLPEHTQVAPEFRRQQLAGKLMDLLEEVTDKM